MISRFDDRTLRERLAGIKHVALDMDGTIYLGNNIFPFTIPFLKGLSETGISYSFLTNNPTKSIGDYLAKLSRMGISADESEMYTTVIASIDYIRAHHPLVKKLFILGTPSMTEQFLQAGFEAATDSADDVPDMVVVSFDMTLQYSRLCRASWWVKQGIPYLATNPDKVCPTDSPTVLVDCGSICKCIEWATGRKPDITMGKPDPEMLRGIMHQRGLEAGQIAMVGDRIYTDIAMAQNAGAFSVLVLSGETTLEVALESPNPPDLIVENIGELGALLTETI
ncbi:MAG: HAD-IIA family hydrolase [Bacteroidales bacterium]|nr:HAD-IIA family hydrolase [Candidatus Cacconaster caballi]